MRVLYLHGLDSNPSKEKIELLTDYGYKVTAPHIIYRQFENDISLFEGIIREIKDSRIDFIIGSSFGGYMGFWASEIANKKALLFNPAIMRQSSLIPVNKTKSDTPKIIVLGKNDDVVDPKETKEFVNIGKYQNISVYEWDFAHRVSLENFEAGVKLINTIIK
jgi:uncharacterized protein